MQSIKPRDDRNWRAKAFTGSDFKHLASLIDAHFQRIPEGDFKGIAGLAAATLKMAFLDAEEEVKRHPDAMGYMQEALLSKPTADQLDMIDLYCQILSLETEFVRETSCHILDRIADRVRQERSKVSAKVACLASARARKTAHSSFDPSLIFLVQSGRYSGQYALAF